VFGVSNQAGIFGRGMGRGRTIDVNLNGREINEMVRVAGQMMDEIRRTMPDAQVRPEPSLELLYPEARFVPDGDALRSVGMSAQEFGVAVDVLMDGRRIGDFKQEGHRKIDLVVKVADADIGSPQELAAALLPTPKGRPVQVSSLSHMEETSGLTEIRHLESNRAISLQITPPYSVTLQEAMETINNQIVPSMQQNGQLENTTVTMSGTADRLQETRIALQWNFLLAALITYLLMSALYSNFIYPIVIMLTVPLAGAGGVIGLKLVNMFIGPQQLDVLTMLGFILLIGIVVKNPILIVHQSLINIRVGAMQHREAVLEATRSRLRPIYMTAASSIFGMLPLVIWPGAGSELYRGLGSVVLGGLALSTFFTVFLTPSLLMFVIWMEKVPSEIAAGEDVSIVSQPDRLVPAK
jgi:HAE1 family hydrophobic/amphiphilic exporter-1